MKLSFNPFLQLASANACSVFSVSWAFEEKVVNSPSLLELEWSELPKFEHNPDCDISCKDWTEEAIAE